MRPDQEKLDVMVRWPLPTTIKALRDFLGLTGYYRKFIQGYAKLAAPLPDLLWKDNFIWSEKITTAFVKLKKEMPKAPVLAYPNFSKLFVIETDTCDTGIGVVLT